MYNFGTLLRLLGPGATRKKVYQQYLNSQEWETLRKKALLMSDYKCTRCQSKGPPLEVHHTSYKNLGTPEEIYSLVVLCRKCHEMEHNSEFKKDTVFGKCLQSPAKVRKS